MKSTSWIRVLTVLVATAGSLGANFYIAPSGSDANPCTSSSRCLTPHRGISLMEDGDTLWIADGTYTAGRVSGRGCALDAMIYVGPEKSCPNQGCTIRAENVTSPPSVTFVGRTAGIVVKNADNWTVQGVETIAKQGVAQCSSTRTTYRDLRLVSTAPGAINLLVGGSGVLFERIETYPQGKPCELPSTNSGRAFVTSDIQDVTISESYIGHVFGLMSLVNTNGFTLKRSHVQHWANHGIVMKKRTRNVLIENNVFGGKGAGACMEAAVRGPRLIDLYEVVNLTVRNNTMVGHGYTPRSGMISYYRFLNMYAGCTLNAQQPGFCEFDTSVVCTDNNIAAIPGVAYSSTSVTCPLRNDGLAWSPRQRCAGVCELANVKFYNNIVYDLRDRGTPEAGTRYVDWESQPPWSETTNLELDGNYYSEGVEKWFCGGGGGQQTTLAAWRATQCPGSANPDPHSVVGRCSATTTKACGADADCPGSQSCVKAPPAFVNYTGENYRPAAGAIQIDAGMNGTDAQGVARCASEDFDGNPRDDGACDIGAFEANGGGTPPPDDPPGQVQNPRRGDTSQ